MAFIGNIFGAYAARQLGRFNQALYNQQAAIDKRNAEIKLRVFKQVPRVVFGRGAFAKLLELLEDYRKSGYIVFTLDHANKTTGLLERPPNESEDFIQLVDTTEEPKTNQVDELRDKILSVKSDQLPLEKTISHLPLRKRVMVGLSPEILGMSFFRMSFRRDIYSGMNEIGRLKRDFVFQPRYSFSN